MREQFLSLMIAVFLASGLGAQGAPGAQGGAAKPALAYLEIDGRALAEQVGTVALADVWREPEVQEFLKPVLAMWPMVESRVAGPLQAMGMDGVTVLDLVRHKVTISFSGLEMITKDTGFGQMELPSPQGVLRFEGDRVPQLVKLLHTVLQQEDTPATVVADDVGGFKVEKTTSPDGMDFFGAHRGQVLVLSASKADLMAELAGKGPVAAAAGGEAWRTVSAACRFEGAPIRLFIDTRGIHDMVQSMADSRDAAEVASVFEMLLMSGQAIGYSTHVDGKAFVERSYSSGVDLFGETEPGAQRLVSAETRLFATSAVSVPKYLRIMTTMMKRVPDAEEELERLRRDMAAVLGFDLEKELLPLLADETAIALEAVPGSVIPSAVLIQKVKDGAKVSALLRRLCKQGPFRAPTRTHGFRGTEVNVLALDPDRFDGEGAPRPTWAVADDRLVVSAWPQAVRRYLAHQSGNSGSLATAPRYREAFAPVMTEVGDRPVVSLTYLDTAAFARFVHLNAAPALQMFAPRDEVPVDFDLLPVTETITRHLFPVAGATYRDGGGAGSVMRTPIPSASMGAVAFLSAFFVAGAREVRPTPAPPQVFEVEPGIGISNDEVERKELESLVQLFRLKEGRLPKDSEWPKFLKQGSARDPGPYFEGAVDSKGFPRNSRGQRWRYRRSETARSGFEIYAAPTAEAAPAVAVPVAPKTKAGEARAEIATLSTAVKLFRLYEGRNPRAGEWPAFLLKGSASYPTPYVRKQQFPEGIVDPWGNPYVYEPLGRKFRIRSYGADGQPGGEGDAADISSK